MREHADSWDTGRCGLPAKLAWNVSRAAWSLFETSKDVREDAGGILGKLKGDDGGGRQVRTAMQLCHLPVMLAATKEIDVLVVRQEGDEC